jgi:polyisoprenoid-binding protein YceI
MTGKTTDWLTTATGTWVLDPVATTIALRTKAMWVLGVKATLRAQSGTGAVTPDGTVSGSLIIDASSIDTGNARRDKHLLTKDFFEVETYPTFTYTVTSAVPAADGTVAVTGSLTVHGKTRPLDLVATVVPSGTDRVTITAETDVDRSQWGLDWTKLGANLHNHLVVNAVFTKA